MTTDYEDVPTSESLLTVREAQTFYHASRSTIARWISLGLLAVVRKGRTIRIQRDQPQPEKRGQVTTRVEYVTRARRRKAGLHK